ncbi:MAG: acetylxylan esterase [Chloroflexia bacterium]|nr:acetylxylan esterase [Chloroflexia bacterium]
MTHKHESDFQTQAVPQAGVTDSTAPAATIRAPERDAPQARSGRPGDLDAWWDAIDDELSALPANPEFERQALQSTDFATMYRVRMTSVGNYPIAAWLSIPTGEGPFPVVIATPGYGSVVTPSHYDMRQRFVTMTIMSRGQRGADKPYAAAYPGHLTEGIASPDTYVFRGVVADLIRAYEVLTALPEVDPDQIGITGNDMALLLAARRPGARAVQVTATFWYRLAELAASTEAYPYEEINDYLRTYPDDRDAVGRTLAYLDPHYQIGRIAANVQINRDRESAAGDDAWLADLVTSINSDITYYDITHEGQTDHDANDAWLSGQLGVEPSPRLWQTQEIGPWS